MSEEKKIRQRKSLAGVVVSDKMDKTIVVQIEQTVMHPIYKKYVRRRLKYKAHDEANTARMGDTVEIAFTRPMSKTKCWRLVKVLRSDRLAMAERDEAERAAEGGEG